MTEEITVLEPLDRTLIQLLNDLPTSWKDFEANKGSVIWERALTLLVAAVMTEQRRTMKLRIAGYPKIIYLQFRGSGAGAIRELLKAISPTITNWLKEAAKTSNDIFFETDPVFQMRLTESGCKAREDVAAGQLIPVLDFIHKRGIFQFREPESYAYVESLDIKDINITQAGSIAIAQAQANVGDIKFNPTIQNHVQINNDAVADVISIAFEKMNAVLETALGNKQESKNNTKKSSKTYPPKRSWTSEELEEAVRDYRAKRVPALDEFISILDSPLTSRPQKRLARRNAIKLFGRNAIARALGVKSAKMVGETLAWRALASLLELPRKVDDVAKKYSMKKDFSESEDVSLPRSAVGPYDEPLEMEPSPDSILMQQERKETLKCIRKLMDSFREDAKDRADSLLSDYEEGIITDEQVRQIVDSLLNDE